jgi:hypothetical protein
MTLTNKLTDYKRFFVAAANHDVPRLQSLISTAVRSGAGINAITRKIESAFAGLYIPKSFSQAEMDLAQLILRLGGRQLLYALSHSLGLPSLRTIYNHMNLTRITPTIGPIIIAGIVSNITECIIKPRQEVVPPPPPRGVSIVMDETKIEQRPMFFKHFNSVGGLCNLHTSAMQVILSSWEAGMSILQALQHGAIHLGKEISVVGAMCFGES